MNENMKQEYFTKGKHGTGYIILEPDGKRIAMIEWKNKTTTKVESNQVDLEYNKSQSLKDSIYYACHKTNILHIFQKRIIKGPKALINIFYRPKDEYKGYAILTKKGTNPLRFSLERLDLQKMQEKTPLAALQKVAFASGKISLKN
jgi:hypothetical protein